MELHRLAGISFFAAISSKQNWKMFVAQFSQSFMYFLTSIWFIFLYVQIIQAWAANDAAEQLEPWQEGNVSCF